MPDMTPDRTPAGLDPDVHRYWRDLAEQDKIEMLRKYFHDDWIRVCDKYADRKWDQDKLWHKFGIAFMVSLIACALAGTLALVKYAETACH